MIQGVLIETEKPLVFKIPFEFGRVWEGHHRMYRHGIKTGCPFGVPNESFKEYDVFAVGGGCCHHCDCFVAFNFDEQYVLCDRNIQCTIPQKYKELRNENI